MCTREGVLAEWRESGWGEAPGGGWEDCWGGQVPPPLPPPPALLLLSRSCWEPLLHGNKPSIFSTVLLSVSSCAGLTQAVSFLEALLTIPCALSGAVFVGAAPLDGAESMTVTRNLEVGWEGGDTGGVTTLSTLLLSSSVTRETWNLKKKY